MADGDSALRNEIRNKDRNESESLPNASDVNSFYSKAAAYWEKIPPTLDGVLGGFGDVSPIDLSGSQSFLKGIFNMSNPPGHVRAVDCGAGIGRITKNLLQKYFGKVDLVEQSESFLNKAKENFALSKKIGSYFCMSLLDFDPPPNTYDVVWCQWVLGHLTDDDLQMFLSRMAASLRMNGVVVIKENISQECVELDAEDSSVTRPASILLKIFKEAGFKVIRNMVQTNFPEEWYEVRMFCLRPIANRSF